MKVESVWGLATDRRIVEVIGPGGRKGGHDGGGVGRGGWEGQVPACAWGCSGEVHEKAHPETRESPSSPGKWDGRSADGRKDLGTLNKFYAPRVSLYYLPLCLSRELPSRSYTSPLTHYCQHYTRTAAQDKRSTAPHSGLETRAMTRGGGAGGGGGSAGAGGSSGALAGGHPPGGAAEDSDEDADAAIPSELLAPLLAMQTRSAAAAAASAERPPRYVVRLSGALAALCGQENEEALYFEDEVMGKLRAVTLALSTESSGVAAAAASVLAALIRSGGQDAVLLTRLWEAGLITYPSPLLAPLLKEWRDVLVKHVLSRLDPTDCAILAQVARPWLAVVVANNLPRAGKGGAVPLQIADFVRSTDMLAWAKDNGCPWERRMDDIFRTCALIALDGHLDVLQWAREHDCPWDEDACVCAAGGGHLEVLQWAREHGCPWDGMTCDEAAEGGHFEMLKWAWEQGCPRETSTARAPLRAGTWQCCSGRGSTAGAYTRPLFGSM